MTKEEQALLVIDALCEDECMRINHDLSNHPKSCFPCLVYRIAHSASQSCLNTHEEWKKEINKLYECFVGNTVKKLV